MKQLLNQEFELNQAESGGSLEEQRVLQEEAEKDEVLNQIRSGQQSFEEIPRPAQFVEADEGYEDEISIAEILQIIETGTEQEIGELLEGAVSVSAVVAQDKAKLKKQLSHLDKIVSVLEASARLKANPESENRLSQYRQQISVTLRNGDMNKAVELISNQQLRTTLEQGIRNSRVQTDSLRQQEVARLPGKSQAEVIQVLQKESQLKVQIDLREAFKKTEEIYKLIQSKLAVETNPATVASLKQALVEVTRQAQAIKDIAQQSRTQTISQQSEAMRSLQQILVTSQQSLKALPLNQQQHASLTQMLESRMANIKSVQSQQVELQAMNRVAEISSNRANLRTAELASQTLARDLRANPTIQPPELLKTISKDSPSQIKDLPGDQIKIDQSRLKVEPQAEPNIIKTNIIRNDLPATKPEIPDSAKSGEIRTDVQKPVDPARVQLSLKPDEVKAERINTNPSQQEKPTVIIDPAAVKTGAKLNDVIQETTANPKEPTADKPPNVVEHKFKAPPSNPEKHIHTHPGCCSEPQKVEDLCASGNCSHDHAPSSKPNHNCTPGDGCQTEPHVCTPGDGHGPADLQNIISIAPKNVRSKPIEEEVPPAPDNILDISAFGQIEAPQRVA